MRGEDNPIARRIFFDTETPPHAWGRPLTFTFAPALTRNTPTCVGKTPAQSAAPRWRRKHPHMRGEDVLPIAMDSPWTETPPHAWGRRCRGVPPDGVDGNTPTCVGKTDSRKRPLHAYQKHPHMRGEDGHGLHLLVVGQETPPHAWGRLPPAGLADRAAGNTPTCVGKTAEVNIGEVDDAETPPHAWGRPVDDCGHDQNLMKHPHMRGEDFIVFR